MSAEAEAKKAAGGEGHQAPQHRRRPRNLVVCATDTPASAAACEWAIKNLYREGDIFHLTYIVKCLLPNMEIFHGMPGTAYSFSRPGEEHRELQLVDDAKRRLEARFLPLFRPHLISYQLHMYAERCDCTQERVCELIMKDVEERDADLVILAAHNKEGEHEGVGSVAAYMEKNCVRPLAIVRPKAPTH